MVSLRQLTTRVVVVFIGLLSLPIQAPARQFGQSIPPFFERILTSEGLSRGTIYSILQDRRGYFWLGTATGLLRYDGYTFKRYNHNPNDTNSIAGDFIWSVCEDSAGDLWVGTSGRGLDRYLEDQDRFIHYRNIPKDSSSLIGDEVVWVYVDRVNDVWAGSWNNGLNRYNRRSNTFTRFADPAQLPSNNVHRIYEDRTGRFWVGTRRGLALFDRNTLTSRLYKADDKNPRSLIGEYIYAISETHAGTVWFGTDRGICRYDPSTDDFVRVELPHIPTPVTSIREDDLGNLWVGTDGGGLISIDIRSGKQTTFTSQISDPGALPSNVVLSLYCDKAGALWVGTVATGLAKFDPHKKKFHHIRTDPPTVNAFCEDSQRTLWIATQGGVKRLPVAMNAKNEARPLTPLLTDPVYALCEDRLGHMWIGSPESGLYCYDLKSGTLHSLGVPPSPSENTPNFITSLFLDSRGDLWIGQSGGGVSRYDIAKKTFEHHSVRTHPQFPSNYVWAIHEDLRGNLWIGTWGIGVIRFDPRTGISVIFEKESNRGKLGTISGQIVVAIAEDSSGTLWFGTWGDGLNSFDPGTEKFTHYSVADGLPNDQIYGILVDDNRGELWLTTGNGLARFNPSTGVCHSYDEGDGVQSLEFRRGAVHRGRSGMMYVGGVNGFNAFTPDEIGSNTHIPPVQLTSVQVLGREIPAADSSHELSYHENFLAFEFASLDFEDPRKNGYMYRLEGLEREWVNAGTRRYVSYANLAPGAYVFHVKGSNNDGVWNSSGARYAFTISYPPWQTWWAYTIYSFVLLSAGIGWRRFEINKIRRKEREEAAIREAELKAELEKQQTRIQIARDLHDEVGGTLSSIAFFAEAMEKRGEEDARNKFLSLIAEGSSKAKEAMSDIVWSIDPSNDSWESTVAKFQRYASDLFESRGIVHTILMPAYTEGILIDPKRRRHLWLLFKEILTNSARHSRCTKVSIELTHRDGLVCLDVEDNGIGIALAQASLGHGIKNIRARAEAMGAELTLETSVGTGTAWKIIFRVGA